MNTKDRERIIAALADRRTDSLSDDDIDAIYDDSELRGLYEAMCLLRRASVTQSKPQRYSRFITYFAGRRRIAAAVLVSVALASAAAFFFGTGSRSILNAPVADDDPLAASVTVACGAPAESSVGENGIVAPADDIVFENLTLDEIAGRLADIYGCKTVFGQEADHSLRLFITIPAGTTLAGAVGILDSFDAIKASLNDNTIHID